MDGEKYGRYEGVLTYVFWFILGLITLLSMIAIPFGLFLLLTKVGPILSNPFKNSSSDRDLVIILKFIAGLCSSGLIILAILRSSLFIQRKSTFAFYYILRKISFKMPAETQNFGASLKQSSEQTQRPIQQESFRDNDIIPSKLNSGKGGAQFSEEKKYAAQHELFNNYDKHNKISSKKSTKQLSEHRQYPIQQELFNSYDNNLPDKAYFQENGKEALEDNASHIRQEVLNKPHNNMPGKKNTKKQRKKRRSQILRKLLNELFVSKND